ncbi:MAG TPA: hypothetical protein VIO94_15885 [Phenylobacterium sp.]
MTDSMVERVGKQIHYEGCGKGLWPIRSWGLDKKHDEAVLALAKAAILAMREPTEAMIEAGEVAIEWGLGASGVLRSMTDEALRDEALR